MNILRQSIQRAGLLVTVALVIFASPVGAQNFTQTIPIRPGWNAIWLEVQPENNEADTVFGTLPITSAWSRADRTSAVDFIQDPSEQTFNAAGWLGWLPPSRPESLVNSLFTVQANQPYLIKSTNATVFNWTVTGRPSLRRPQWVADSFSLRGLPVDPAASPTFLSFLRHSAAHYDEGTGNPERIYRLNSVTGQWEAALGNDTVESGRAYWIFTRGASDFLAPFSAQVDLEDGLDYGLDLTELNLRLQNNSDNDVVGSMQEVMSGGSSALSLFTFSPNEGGNWVPLPSPIPVGAEAGSNQRLRLAIRRQALSGPHYESVLDIRDGAGTRLLVPVAADRLEIAEGGQASRAGLWVGSATINAVTEPNSDTPFTPTPTKASLSMRMIIHIDGTGQARLLREVTQMWQDGSFTNNAAGEQVVEQPGKYVLITEDSLLPFFGGAAVRDGQSVGRRLSTIAYDFAGTTTNNYLNLTGRLEVDATLSGILALPYDHPRNPFKHKFHPDHDNQTARYDGPAVESFEPTRVLYISFSASPPNGPATSDFGYNTMGGAYQEVISGLHKTDILISGTFRLQRISTTDTLNPNPSL